MKHIDSMGVFWVPGESDGDTLSGRLTFDPSEGGRLQLVGGFESSEPVSRSGSPRAFLHGVIDSGPVTIDNCFSNGTRHRYPGIDETTYTVNSMLLGFHVERDAVAFQSVYLQTSGAGEWVGERIVDNDSRRESDAKAKSPVDWIAYTAPPDLQVAYSRGSVSLHYAWKTSSGGSIHSVGFEHWPVFGLTYPQVVALDLLQDDVGRISDLITLCMDEITTTEVLSLSRPDMRVRMLNGSDGPSQSIEYLAPQLSYVQYKQRKPRNEHEMLLTFGELGGLDMVARWLDRSPVFGRALASMLSVKRSGRIFVENRFLNVAFAAEAFHRDVYGGEQMGQAEFEQIVANCLKSVSAERREWLRVRLAYANALSLRRRLVDLASKAGEPVSALIGNPKHWAGLVTDVRNHLTHLDSSKVGFEGSDLYFLSESIYSVVRICMLLEAGVSSEVLAEKAGSEALAWYRTRLADAMGRLRHQVRRTTSPQPTSEDAS